MSKELNKQELWNRLKTPVFKDYVCTTCKYGPTADDCPVGRHSICSELPDTDTTFWRWDKVTYQ